MLGLAQARQVGVNGGDDGTLVAEVDLDLSQVLALFQQVGGVTVAQGVNVRVLFDGAGQEGQTEGALERGAAQGFCGGGGALAGMTLGRKEQRGMTVRFPKLAQEPERALGQRDVAILIALAGADVNEPALGINVAHFQTQGFAQAQAAGINEDQTDPMVQGGDGGQDAAGFGGGEDDGEFEPGIGADQFEFGGPDAFEGFLPEQFEGADDLGGGLAGDLLDGLEVDAILAELLGGDQVGGFGMELRELAQAGEIGLSGAGSDGQEGQVIGERF